MPLPLLPALCALLLAALLAAALLLPPPRLPAGVPHVRGAPLLGSLPGFAADTGGWLRRQATAHGGAFAAHLLRGPCLFLTRPADFGAVWRRTAELSFHEVELDMNRKVLGLAPVACAAAVDAHAHALWARHLSGAALPPLARRLARALWRHAAGAPGTALAAACAAGAAAAADAAPGPDPDGWRPVQLYDLVYRLLWAGAVRVVVGFDDAVADALRDPFRDFDAGFPLLAGGLPPLLARDAVKGRATITAAMLDALRASGLCGAGRDAAAAAAAADGADDGRGARLSGLVRDRHAHFAACGVSDGDSAALNGLLTWPLHANSAPAAFWALAHTLADDAAGGDALRTLQAEADAFAAAHPGFPFSDGGGDDGADANAPDAALLSPAGLDAALPFATACCLEALRLSGSSFGLRVATADVDVPIAAAEGRPARTAAVRPGTRVFLASLHHADEARFPDAAAFRPRRFLPGGGAAAGDVLAFGGGVSKCPGRHFALVELRLLLLALLLRWELRLTAPLPPLHAQRAGLGVLPPKHDVAAQMRARVPPQRA
jgi:hypothetical protein